MITAERPRALSVWAIEQLRVRAFRIPTETPESDGTLDWDATTLVLAEVFSGEHTGIGYTYADIATAEFIQEHFARLLAGINPLEIRKCRDALDRAVRNVGRSGVAAMAISAVDTALWDLAAKILNVPLSQMFGQARDVVPLYGSGGFTNYTPDQLENQLAGWSREGFRFVKMKVGRDPNRDVDRVRRAQQAIGKTVLFVDANGAYEPKQALALAQEFGQTGVRWFEEPVSSDDLESLASIREQSPHGMDIAAGEYGYHLDYFRRMLQMRAVDVLQMDATRCGGYTGFLEAAAVAKAFHIPISAHCAPGLHRPLGASLSNLLHVEFFFDHARIEQMLFDGAVTPVKGQAPVDPSRPGHGLTFREEAAASYAVFPAN